MHSPGAVARRRKRPSGLVRTGIAAVGILSLAGCATFDGRPKDINPKELPADACPGEDDIKIFMSANKPEYYATMEAWRDSIIARCIEQVNAKYNDFLVELHRISVETSLGTDLAALGLSGAGAVVGTSTANSLSAASAGVVGAGAAFNKDAFYQKTLPAIKAQMEANRASVYKDIMEAELSPVSGYSLETAQYDIRRYTDAGTIDTAINGITSAADKARDADTQTAEEIRVAKIQPVELVKKKEAVNKFIHSLDIATHNADLDAIYIQIMKHSPVEVDQATERKVLMTHIADYGTQDSDMAGICAAVQPYSKQDFCK